MSSREDDPLLYLSRREINSLLEPDACRTAMRQVMIALSEGRATLPARTVVSLGEGASGLFMPALLEDPPYLGTKVVAIHPHNHHRGRPSHHGALLVFDARLGRPLALLEGSSVTAIRTAAVSALATDLLALPGARRLALLGTGVQARSHLEALTRVRRFTEIRVWSPRSASRRAFVESAAKPGDGATLLAAETAEEAVRGADVVTTVTASPDPVLSLDWLAPGVHINAVGASTAATREIDTATVAAAALVVDSRSAALEEAGEILLPMAEGRLAASHIRAELGGLAAGREPGRRDEHEITLFKSVGLAVQDLAAAALLLDSARRRGIGRHLDWG